MLNFVFIFYLAIFWKIVPRCGTSSLDINVFQQVKNLENAEVLKKEEEFVKIIWQELTNSLPNSAKLPGIGIESPKENKKIRKDQIPKGASKFWNTEYVCAGESIINPKLAEQQQSVKVLEGKGNWKIVEVDATIIMNNPPNPLIHFNLYQTKSQSDKVVGPIDVKLTFSEKNKVKLVLEIPEISNLHLVTTSECLIKIRNVLVPELSRPRIDSNKGGNELASWYWDVVSSEEYQGTYFMNYVVEVAWRRAIYRKFKGAKNHWICNTKELEKMVNKRKKDYSYGALYKFICKNEKIED